MEISSNLQNINLGQDSLKIKTNFTEKISADEAQELKAQITQSSNEMMLKSTTIQSSIDTSTDFTSTYNDFQNFLDEIGYEGQNIADLSQNEAADLVSEDGFFGITETSDRIANFVIDGSGGNEEMMRAGRDGMIEGFKQAEEMWGGELPEISQKTMEASIEKVDKAMYDLGFSIMDTEV